jgi:hypothetical protein
MVALAVVKVIAGFGLTAADRAFTALHKVTFFLKGNQS